jgi:hypothetical protein
MNESEVRSKAFAMPLTSPAYPVGPYRFCNREYLIITYRTDPKKLRELVPEPLQIEDDVVKFEFIRMPDSTGFGDYTCKSASPVDPFNSCMTNDLGRRSASKPHADSHRGASSSPLGVIAPHFIQIVKPIWGLKRPHLD